MNMLLPSHYLVCWERRLGQEHIELLRVFVIIIQALQNFAGLNLYIRGTNVIEYSHPREKKEENAHA